MDKQTVIRTGVAGAVAAAGLAVGGVAMANADDAKGAEGSYAGQRGPGGPGGPGGLGHRGGPGVGDTAAFAKALGVSEDDLKAALEKVREDRPAKGERPDPEATRSALVTALAKELGVSEEKVTSALEDVQADAKADRRAELVKRLDAAVADDELTADDKASVLKAFDAGVLGGGPRG